MIILDTHSEMTAHAKAIEELSELLKYMQSTNSREVTTDVLKDYFTSDVIHEMENQDEEIEEDI
jgi:hypothetical protein